MNTHSVPITRTRSTQTPQESPLFRGDQQHTAHNLRAHQQFFIRASSGDSKPEMKVYCFPEKLTFTTEPD